MLSQRLKVGGVDGKIAILVGENFQIFFDFFSKYT